MFVPSCVKAYGLALVCLGRMESCGLELCACSVEHPQEIKCETDVMPI